MRNEESDFSGLASALEQALRRTRRQKPLFFAQDSPLTQAQFTLLHTLNHHMHHPETLCGAKETDSPCPGAKVNWLAHVLSWAPPAVSQRVNELEQLGLVTRVPSKEDRRVTYVCLTEDGHRALAEARTHLTGFYERLIDHMGRENTGRLVSLLNLYLGTAQALAETRPEAEETIGGEK